MGWGRVCVAVSMHVCMACATGGNAEGPEITPIPMAAPPAKPVLPPSAPSPVPLELENLECGEHAPVPYEGRLLTRLQYQNTVADLFDTVVIDAAASAALVKDFPAENEVLGYRTNAEFHRATPWLVEAHIAAAESVAGLVAGQLARALPCAVNEGTTAGGAPVNPEQGSTEDVEEAAAACAEEFLERYGDRAFRRPMQASEREIFADLFAAAYHDGGLENGIMAMVQALLQSPQFLYRFELAQTAPAADGSAYALDSYELASRLSYLLWNTLPDEELWQSAASGALSDVEELRAQATRLLAASRAGITIADFTEQWLGLPALASAVRRVGVEAQSDGTDAPIIDGRYSAPWQQSLKYYVADQMLGGGTFAGLFTSQRVFVNQDLWSLYPSQTPFTGDAQSFVGVDYPTEQRAGLLTQPALMALLSHPDQSAPILRGVFVRNVLLCDPPPPPPPTVNPTPPELDPTATTRERFAQHTKDASCANCHRLFDPIGLGLENYDELGRFRHDENGLPLDVSGEIVKARDATLDGEFTGAGELAARLARSSQTQACFVTQWYRYGMGRVEQAEDLCSIRQVYDAFAASGGDLKSVLIGLVLSDGFRYRSVPPSVDAPLDMQPTEDSQP